MSPHSMTFAVSKRSTRTLGAFLALCFHGARPGFAHGREEALDHSPRRHLQTGVSGTVVYVEASKGEPILPLQENGAALVSAELGPTSATADSIEFKSDESGAAEYEIYSTPPSDVSGGLTVNLVAQLGTDAVDEHWKVDLFDFVGEKTWTSIGDLAGVTLGSWEDVSVGSATGDTASNFVDPVSGQILVRLYTEDATSQESIYVDQLQILESDSSAPSPVPSATAGPAPSPVDVDPGIIGVALYVEGVEGIPILETQSGGTQLAAAENGETSATADSIGFSSTDSGVADFEMYCSPPGVLTAGLTVSVVAQLAAGANAGNWKLDLYDYLETSTWVNVGDLTGATTGSWSTVNLAEASGAGNFVNVTTNEMLVRLYTSGASNQETIYLDQLQIFGGSGAPSPVSPSPVIPSPTVAPVVAPVALPAAPVDAGVVGAAVYVERVEGVDILETQADGTALAAAENGETSATADSIGFSSTTSGIADFEMYCSPPGVLTAGLTVSVVAQLAAGSTAGNWKLDLFDYFETRTWVNFGDLTGAATGSWSTVDLAEASGATNFVNTTTNEMLVRLYTSGASTQETIYLDQLQIIGGSGAPSPISPSPVIPSPTVAPVVAPVALPAAPVDVGVVGAAVYVERVEGVDILETQADGAALAVAENDATSETANSIEFSSTTAGIAQYEIYCSPPGVLTAGLTVSTVIQLATGATAGHWKLDLYDYADTNTWKNVGDLTGAVTTAWSTVSLALTSGASDYVNGTTNEMLVRVYTSEASTQETIYLDQLQIFGGDSQPSPSPSPVTAPTTAAPVIGPTFAPSVAPAVGPVGSPPVTVGDQQRWPAFSQFVPDWSAWKLNLGNGVCEPLEECRTDPACCDSTAPAVCGNGMCEETETRDNCNKDCTFKLSVCGNGVCESGLEDNYHNNWFEDEFNCPVDCATSPNLDVNNQVTGSCFMSGGTCDDVCGDGICSGSDTCVNCPRDCGECLAVVGDGICSYPFEPALVGDCAGESITNFVTLDGEDYATIDNAEVLDDVYLVASCTSGPTALPAGWRLADWDASVAMRLVTVSLARFDTGCLVFKGGNAVSTETGLQGDSASGCGITPIIRHNGNKFSVAPKDCASRLMIQRIKESGTKNCPTCSNGSLCNTLIGTCACNGMWTGPGCDRAIGDFSVPSLTSSWYKPALGATWEWQIDGEPIPGSDGPGDLYDVEIYDIDYSYPSSVIADLQSKGKKVMCYISAGTSEDFREDINLFPYIAKGGIVSFDVGDTFADENWLDLRRLDVIAPIMLERLDIMATKGCDAVEWDNADLPVHQTGLSVGGQISVSLQIAYNAWLAAQTHARGMGVAMKNNNEAAAFNVKDYDMVVNEECWIKGTCPNYWPWIKAGKPILNTEYFTARCMYCTQANLMNISTIKKVPDLTSCRVDCKSSFSSIQCDAASVSGSVAYPIDWTIGTGAVMNTDWCPMTLNTAADECSAPRFATCDPNVGY